MKNSSNKDHAFNYLAAAPLNQRLILLRKDDKIEVGPWKGEHLPDNKTYKAWAELPAQDLALEKTIGYR
jgi:hypothetical protein